MNLKMELSYAKWVVTVRAVRTALLVLLLGLAYNWGGLWCLAALARDLPRITEVSRDALTPIERCHPDMVVCCILFGIFALALFNLYSLAWLIDGSRAKLFAARQEILARGILYCGAQRLNERQRTHLEVATRAYKRAGEARAAFSFDYPRERVSAFGVVVDDGIEQLRLAMETSALD